MEPNDLEFDDIFNDLSPEEYNEFGLRRQMRFISERIIAEYCPSDCLSTREIIHPMAAHRVEEPFFVHQLTDKSKNEFVTALDLHDHSTYFPYAKNTGDIMLARYISNFNDINFTKISGQILCSFPGETVHGLRIGRMDRGLLAVNHRTGTAPESTVTVVDLIKPARNIAFYDSQIPVNTIDWIWGGIYYLAIGDDKSLRVADVRCPKSVNAVFFNKGVKKTALALQRQGEIACWDGEQVFLYDYRRPDVPCNVYDVGLKPDETVLEMRFNPYITKQLFVHTSQKRVVALEVNPATCLTEWRETEPEFNVWQIITFKHVDRGCTSSRYSVHRRETMPFEDVEVPLLGYYEQYEASKYDSEIPVPTIWRNPNEVDENDFMKIDEMNEIDFESYLTKAVERAAAELSYSVVPPKVLYEAFDVETYDFALPGVNGIMCLSREDFEYKIVTSPNHYEGDLFIEGGANSVHFYRGIQIQEMIPAQTFLMFIDRLERGWNAYMTSEKSLKKLAYKITHKNRSFWSKWLRKSARMQYGRREFKTVGTGALTWEQMTPLMKGPLPVVELPPYEEPKDKEAAEEVCQMVAPFFRLFLPNPQADIPSEPESDSETQNPPVNPYEHPPRPHPEFPDDLSYEMRTLCKCHAKMRYYNKKKRERKYQYVPVGDTFLLAASRRIREKFWRLGWKSLSKSQILSHRLSIDAKISRKSIVQDLNRFQRFTPREFQKRVLPPKMITDASSVLLKPEYIKEREEKEREMKEKSAQKPEAPIGLSVAKRPKDKSVSNAAAQELIEQAKKEEDPERARFLMRAAMQLADNEPEKKPEEKKKPVQEYRGRASARPRELTQAMGTKGKDDFEYETAEDAYFGIKKKRMYVVYRPATAPLGLKRYKPDRLLESNMIRRLEHLVYWGSRTYEKKILYGQYKESDKRQSSIKERQTLDFKKSFNAHKKVAWQTFYDKYFFFSDKFSYNQILRKVIQMYNIMCHGYQQAPTNYAQHERLLFGINPKSLIDRCSVQEAIELRTDCTLLESTIPRYKHFMSFLQFELPYQFDQNAYTDAFTGAERPVKVVDVQMNKPTAEYDRDTDFMFPTGRLRFFEMEIPPDIMEGIYERRRKAPRKKTGGTYLEDIPSTCNTEFVINSLRKTNSCPNLCTDFSTSQQFDDVIYTEGVRQMMSRRQTTDQTTSAVIEQFNFDGLIDEDETEESHQFENDHQAQLPRLSYVKNTVFIEWDSPMIADTDRVTKEKFMRRVVPYPEPQPPRQIHGIDFWFDFIPLEIRQAAMGNTVITWCYYDPALLIFPGIQCLNAEHDQIFALCPKVPLKFGKQKQKVRNPEFDKHGDEVVDFLKSRSALKDSKTDQYSNWFADAEATRYWSLVRQKSTQKVFVPVFEQCSINVPVYLMELLKPSFSGFFADSWKSRYSIQQVAEMRGKRELQQEIMTRRMIRFRQPLIEETEHELKMAEEEEEDTEDINIEEDDLKTTSEESEGEEESDEEKEQRLTRERRRIVKEVLETVLELVEDADNARRARAKKVAFEEKRKEEERVKEESTKHQIDEKNQTDIGNVEHLELPVDQIEKPENMKSAASVPETLPADVVVSISNETAIVVPAKDLKKSGDDSSSSDEELPPRRKYGYAWPKYGYIPNYSVYIRYNPHTRANIKLLAERENQQHYLLGVLNEVYHEDLIEEKMAGGMPRPGTPEELAVGQVLEPFSILGPLMELVRKPPSFHWEEPIDHKPREEIDDQVSLFPVNQLELDADYIRKLYKQQFNKRVRSSDSLERWFPRGKFKGGKKTRFPRRASLEYFQPKSKSVVCSACIEEPWPTKEMCIVCHPNTAVYRCSNIINLKIPCDVCGANIYKFSCMNYEVHVQQLRKMTARFEKATRRQNVPDEKLRAMLSVNLKPLPNDSSSLWDDTTYQAGDETIFNALTLSQDADFYSGHNIQLSNLIHRDFHYICWYMDDMKAEKVCVSEEFSVAFDRDADVDLMRDTMNTISQDGEMDMMTTYDQKTGMRVRRWISYAALNTRMQKQAEKAKKRQRAADREAKILSGEINVRPALLTELKKKVEDKKVAVQKAQEEDEQKKVEERRREYKLWKKLPIPEFIDDPKKAMPDFPALKQEDWLESSGSEDELPPIRSRMQSKEIKEFIAAVRQHMSKKPAKFDGLRVTYGKLFEKRPLLKNDIVLVTKKRNLKKKPPPFRIQRIPLDDTWLNDSLRVSFLPAATPFGYPKDSNKWTVPFYSSKKLHLSRTELKKRTFRPPTPPRGIAAEYREMKTSEKAYFYRQNVRKWRMMKKARAIRQVRFRGALIGFGKKTAGRVIRKFKKQKKKTWRMARRKLVIKKAAKRMSATVQPFLKKKEPKYVFSYFLNTSRGKPIPLSKRKESRLSSDSDSDICPIIRIPRKKKQVKRAKVSQEVKPTIQSCLKVGLLDRRKSVLINSTPQIIVLPTVQQRETGQLARRSVDPSQEIKFVSQFPVNYKKSRKGNQMISEKTKTKISDPKNLLADSTKYLATKPSTKKTKLTKRLSKKSSPTNESGQETKLSEHKKSKQETDVPLKPDIVCKTDAEVEKRTHVPKKRSKSATCRGRRRHRDNVKSARSFSLDCGLRTKDIRKQLKPIEKKLMHPCPKIPPFKVENGDSAKDASSVPLHGKPDGVKIQGAERLSKSPKNRPHTRKPTREQRTDEIETLKKPKILKDQPGKKKKITETLEKVDAAEPYDQPENLRKSKENSNFPALSLKSKTKKISENQKQTLLLETAETILTSKSERKTKVKKTSKLVKKSMELVKANGRTAGQTEEISGLSRKHVSMKTDEILQKTRQLMSTVSVIPRGLQQILWSKSSATSNLRVLRHQKDVSQRFITVTVVKFIHKRILKIPPEKRIRGVRRERILIPRLRASSESDLSGEAKKCRMRDVRMKRFSRKQLALHQDPTRSKVLNIARKINAKKTRKHELQCERPMHFKLLDMHLNPWIPLQRRSKKRMPEDSKACRKMAHRTKSLLRFIKNVRPAVKKSAKRVEKKKIEKSNLTEENDSVEKPPLKKLRMSVGPDADQNEPVAVEIHKVKSKPRGKMPRRPINKKRFFRWVRNEVANIQKKHARKPVIQKTKTFQPMSWNKKLEKIKRHVVKIRRIRAGTRQREDVEGEDSVDEEKPIGILVEPTKNLKSCLRQGSLRRTLRLGSAKTETPIGFGSGLSMIRPVRSTPFSESVQPRPSHTEHYEPGTDERRDALIEMFGDKSKATQKPKSSSHGEIEGEILTSASQVFPLAALKAEMTEKAALQLRILKPVPLSASDESSNLLTAVAETKTEDVSEKPEVAPPPKLPKDQQWRTAMMARRNFGSSRPVAAPSKPQPKPEPVKETVETTTEVKTDEVEKPEESLCETDLPTSGPFSKTTVDSSLPFLGPIPYANESNVNTGVFTIPTLKMLPIKPEPKKQYVEPVAVPKPTAPPPTFRTIETNIETKSLLEEAATALVKTADKPTKSKSKRVAENQQRDGTQPSTSTDHRPVEKKTSFLDKLRSSTTPLGALFSSVVGKPSTSIAEIEIAEEPVIHMPTSVTRMMPPTQGQVTRNVPVRRPKSPNVSPPAKTTPSPKSSLPNKPSPPSKASPSPKQASDSLPVSDTVQVSQSNEENDDLPLLPRIKRPETGQLIKKLPPNAPKPPVAIGPIVKYVGGKPITNSPRYRKSMSQRAPPPPPPPPPLSSSSSDEEDMSIYVHRYGDIPTTSSPEFFEEYQDDPPPLYITEKQRLAEEAKRQAKLAAEKEAAKKEAAEKPTSVLKPLEGTDSDKQSTSGKSVTFGPTFAIDPSPPYVPPPPPPEPAPPPGIKLEDQKHIFHMDLPESLKNETPEQQRKRLGLPEPKREHVPIAAQSITPSTTAEQPQVQEVAAVARPPPASVTKSFLFGIKPFGKITPKSEKAQAVPQTPQVPSMGPAPSTEPRDLQEAGPSRPSTSGPSLVTEHCSEVVSGPSTSSVSEPSTSQPRPIPQRKHSTRRQLRSDDPSPLQLSGDASLPKPAEWSPEKPVQLETPKPVQNYKSVSQRKYYTKFGQEWKPPKSRVRMEDSEDNLTENPSTNPPPVLQNVVEPEKAKRKRKKKKAPTPGEPTLVLDGTEHFNKLTAENLKLLEREFPVEEKKMTTSLKAANDEISNNSCLKPEKLKRAYRDFKKSLKEVDEGEKMVTAGVIFSASVDNSVVKIAQSARRTTKYETAGMKVRRMMRTRKQRIKAASDILPSSRKTAAINAARQVRKVRFFQEHKKRMMPILPKDFEPKSILKKPKTIKWRYRIDFEGNKKFMRTFGPSVWQKRMDEQSSENVPTQKRKPKAMRSYLKCWTKVVSGIAKQKLNSLSEKEKARLNIRKTLGAKREVRPKDILVSQPTFGILVPSVSLSSVSGSPNGSLSSLLDAIPPVTLAVTTSQSSATTPSQVSRHSSASVQGRPRRSSSTHKEKEGLPEQQPSKHYPVVFIGMTVGRSPSTSTSMVSDLDAVESIASDGSQIIEYQGHEVAEQSSMRRRLDPFVRPLSALFKAFTSNMAEIAVEAHPRSRPMERGRFSELFRRSSPSLPDFLPDRPQSSSPTRRRCNRTQLTSVSQGSSAEDILALMKAQPDALRQMEEQARKLFPSLKLPQLLPPALPMFEEKKKLKQNMFKQIEKMKHSVADSKIDAINDALCKPGTRLNCTMIRKLVNFNMDEYMRVNRFPRPTLNFALLGKYKEDSLRIQGRSQIGCNKAVRMIVKKMDKCRERLEKAKDHVRSRNEGVLSAEELTTKARNAIKIAAGKKKRKIRVQYKFKKTCVKYRVEVTVTRKPKKPKTRGSNIQNIDDKQISSRLDGANDTKSKGVSSETTVPDSSKMQEFPKTFDAMKKSIAVPDDAATLAIDSTKSNDDLMEKKEEKPENEQNVVEPIDYDGDDDCEPENEEEINNGALWNTSKLQLTRENQRKKFLRYYFQFAVRMARKVARRSVGNKNPILFYSFISQMRTRMTQFMNLRKNNVSHRFDKKSATSHLERSKRSMRKTRDTPHKKWMSRCLTIRRPPIVRKSLKYGITVKKEVVVKHSKFSLLKKNARVESFFQCLDEYIDVGTPIKLVFRSCNTLLPKKVFDVKTKLVDTDIYTSPSPVNTDSDYSTDTLENPRVTTDQKFFNRDSLESTYRVKGLPGLIYLARLVQERIGDDIERNIPFSGTALEYSKQVVYVSPIRRLMLLSLGLVMPDRVHRIKMVKKKHDKFDLWFGRLFKMICYGRGDLCRYVISKLCRAQGPPIKNYDKMDIHYQAYVTNKLFKKMIYLNDGKEANMAVQELIESGLDLDTENPFATAFQPEKYDKLIFEDEPWSRRDWIQACDMFLQFAKQRDDVRITCQASLLMLRMLFCGGCTQDIVDELITFRIPLRYKLLFIINLTPPECLMENIIKMFNMVRGLDRLPFVGLGYHADSMQVLFDEAVESGDPQLIAHIIRIGRCLDRRSGEIKMTDAGSKHINNRDHAQIMTDIFTNGKEKWPCGAPTLDEVFPFRYIRNYDGTLVTQTTEELARLMEYEVTRYMAILELTRGSAIAKGDLDHNKNFYRFPSRFYHEVICTGCKMNVHLSRNLGRLGRVLCVSTMPLIEQDKDKKRWPNAKRLTPRHTYENYIETLDGTENKMLMSKDIEEEKTDITVQILPSRFGCFNCRFELPRCVVCMCSFLNDHMDFALQDRHERFAQFAVCNICNHGGHVNHLALWFKREKVCPVNGCDCKCQPLKRVRNLKKRLHHHMLLSVNMRAKSHLCNPACAVEVDIDEGYLPDPDIELFKNC